MQILLDMDGVLADFVQGAADLHRRDSSTVKTWDFYDTWKIAPEDFWAPMGKGFWAGLPKTPEADAIVRKCEAAVGTQNVCLLSSPCDTPGCMDGKLDWIRRHYPQFRRQYIFGPAKRFCAGEGHLLVDDSDTNCQEFRSNGGYVCLLPRPWNAANGLQPLEVLHFALQGALEWEKLVLGRG